MDLTQLRMFCAVAETGSLARAAEVLHRVPSNLTTRLRQLERELGDDLFIREKQRLRLSPSGHNFLSYARRILALSDEALSMAHRGEPAGKFALGSMESAAATRLPALLAAFHQRYPEVALSLTTGTTGEILQQIRQGTLAAGLAAGPVDVEGLSSCVVFSERMVLISGLQHAAIIEPAEASGETLFAFRASCSYRLRFENWFRQAGLQPGPFMEIQSYHTLLSCVASGAGLAMLPESVLNQLPGNEKVQRHSLPDEIAGAVTLLVWRRDAFTPNVKAFKSLILEQNGIDLERQNSSILTL